MVEVLTSGEGTSPVGSVMDGSTSVGTSVGGTGSPSVGLEEDLKTKSGQNLHELCC